MRPHWPAVRIEPRQSAVRRVRACDAGTRSLERTHSGEVFEILGDAARGLQGGSPGPAPERSDPLPIARAKTPRPRSAAAAPKLASHTSDVHPSIMLGVKQ
jgi:hypothetical protein